MTNFISRLLIALRVTFRYVFCDRKLSWDYAVFQKNVRKFMRLIVGGSEVETFQQLKLDPQVLALEAQKTHVFNYQPLVSILTPAFNTPVHFLEELINSVRNQTYSHWELCIANGGDNPDTIKALKAWEAVDSRIKAEYLPANLGIAGNTISAYAQSSGAYVVLLDHDDYLTPDALYEIVKCVNQYPDVDFIYSDRAIFSDQTKELLAYHFLPAYSPDFLRSCNYASHLNAFSKWILDKVGFEREGYDGSQDYDLELRVVEQARRVVNIQKPLYYCRACEGSVAYDPESKMYAYAAGKKAIEEHITRIGFPGEVQFLRETFSYRIKYEIKGNPKISIIIPNKDHLQDLMRCLLSIKEKSTYRNYNVYIVENNSTEENTRAFYNQIEQDSRITVLYYPEREFNFSAINNWAVQYVDGDYLLLLNNDTEVISRGWLEEMLMFVQREDVGAVGAKLYFPDNRIQHSGLVIGLGGHIASHYDHGKSRTESGYLHRLLTVRNYSAVTAACLMVKKADYLQVGGFDEQNFKIGLNDVDFCLKLREIGRVNLVTPYAELYHYEGVTRGRDTTGERQQRFEGECRLFREKWNDYFVNGDPYHNTNIIC